MAIALMTLVDSLPLPAPTALARPVLAPAGKTSKNAARRCTMLDPLLASPSFPPPTSDLNGYIAGYRARLSSALTAAGPPPPVQVRPSEAPPPRVAEPAATAYYASASTAPALPLPFLQLQAVKNEVRSAPPLHRASAAVIAALPMPPGSASSNRLGAAANVLPQIGRAATPPGPLVVGGVQAAVSVRRASNPAPATSKPEPLLMTITTALSAAATTKTTATSRGKAPAPSQQPQLPPQRAVSMEDLITALGVGPRPPPRAAVLSQQHHQQPALYRSTRPPLPPGAWRPDRA
jgi:hypothetical protein